MIGYHVYLPHAYAKHDEHFEDRHPSLRACWAHGQLEVLLLDIFLLLNITGNCFQLILQKFQVLTQAVKCFDISSVLAMCDVTLHWEVKLFALGVSLLPAEINLLKSGGLNSHLCTSFIAHGLDLLASLHGFKRYVLGIDTCNQIIDIKNGLEIGGEPEAVPAWCLQHYL